MLAYNNYKNSANSQHDCLEFSHDNWGRSVPESSSAHDILPTSNHKIYLDKHFRKYVENKKSFTTTTAALHLRNITKGLVIHDNTFEKVYTVAGGVVYIEGFNNTFGTSFNVFV